jgi:hypothetical protein
MNYLENRNNLKSLIIRTIKIYPPLIKELQDTFKITEKKEIIKHLVL